MSALLTMHSEDTRASRMKTFLNLTEFISVRYCYYGGSLHRAFGFIFGDGLWLCLQQCI